MTTLVVDPGALDSLRVEVEGAAYRHLFRARRLAVGERVRLVDGLGNAVWSRVLRVGRRVGVLEVGERAPSNESPLELDLAVAAPRPERAAWLVEKATEVGATAIRFFNCERAPRTYGSSAMSRFRRVAVSAVQQSHRARLPELGGVLAWGQVLELAQQRGATIFLDPGEPLGTPRPAATTLLLLVGPEGGWSEGERHQLQEAGGVALALGPRILRSETAAIVGAALLLSPLGDGTHGRILR
jgi:16S rRNA (uracil1498-N3)-methyltransferase